MEQAELFDPDTGPTFNKDDFKSKFLSPNSPLPKRCFSPMSLNGAGRSKYNGSRKFTHVKGEQHSSEFQCLNFTGSQFRNI